MSKYNKRLRIRPVINSLVAEPRYYYECKDWYGGVGTGLTIPQAVGDYLRRAHMLDLAKKYMCADGSFHVSKKDLKNLVNQCEAAMQEREKNGVDMTWVKAG